MELGFNDAQEIMQGPKNYFGPTLEEFLYRNPRANPSDISDEEKLRMFRNQGKYHFFGPDQWLSVFGNRLFQLGKIPKITWSREQLENPSVKQEHFLFLGIDRIGKQPLTIAVWRHLFPGPKYPTILYDASGDETVCQTRWYLMPIDGIGSHDLSYDEQVKNELPKEYEVPNIVERVTANFLFFILNNRYLDGDSSRVSDCVKNSLNRPLNEHYWVTGFDPEGIAIGSGDAAFLSLAASRKL